MKYKRNVTSFNPEDEYSIRSLWNETVKNMFYTTVAVNHKVELFIWDLQRQPRVSQHISASFLCLLFQQVSVVFIYYSDCCVDYVSWRVPLCQKGKSTDKLLVRRIFEIRVEKLMLPDNSYFILWSCINFNRRMNFLYMQT